MIHIDHHKTHSAICRQAAKEIAAQLKENPESVIGLATGNTMEPLYAELVRMHKEEGLDFSKATFVQLDEFCPIAADDPHSFRYALKKLFLDQVGIRDDQCVFVEGRENFDAVAFEQKIAELGGVDIQLLGIGRTGHIGFNEAGNPRIASSRTRRIELQELSIEDQAGHFGGKKNVIKTAITQGVGTIMEAKKVILLVNGSHKAAIAKNMLEEGSIKDLPARALLKHKNVQMLMDTASTEMLSVEQLKNFAGMGEGQAKKHCSIFDDLVIPLEEGKELRLPYNADIYLPHVMSLKEKFDVRNEAHVNGLKDALKHITATYVGAHADDTELWAPHEVEANQAAVREGNPAHLLSVVATDGGALVSTLKREGKKYESMTPERLIARRKLEQRLSAREAGFPVIQLQYSTPAMKKQVNAEKSEEIVRVMTSIYNALPEHQVAYTHHPADIHETHVAVMSHSVEALRHADKKPEKVIAMPGWGETGINDTQFKVQDSSIVYRLLRHFKTQIEMQARNYREAGTANLVTKAAFLSDPLALADKAGMIQGFDITKAVTKNMSVKQLTRDAYAKQAEIACERMNKVGVGEIEEKDTGKGSGHAGRVSGNQRKTPQIW